MLNKLDAYEVIATLAPGAVLVLAALLLSPTLTNLVQPTGMSFSDLGLFVLLSFIAGYLIRPIVLLVEAILWSLFEYPTSRITKTPCTFLICEQIKDLHTILGISVPRAQWGSNPVIREIYAHVAANGNTTRIDAFNRTYGLGLGLGTAFLLSAVPVCFKYGLSCWLLALFVASLLALINAKVSGEQYGRELFVEFIRLHSTKRANRTSISSASSSHHDQ